MTKNKYSFIIQGEDIINTCGYLATECFILSKAEEYVPQQKTSYCVIFRKHNDNLLSTEFDRIFFFQNELGYNVPTSKEISKKFYSVPYVSNDYEEMKKYCRNLTEGLSNQIWPIYYRQIEILHQTQDEIENFYRICDEQKLIRKY